ncbi:MULTISPECIES: Abi family protein [Acinetobacter]|uniref:Abi family protein n=1 Tax=Acinetobacter TaxID=469 RepID=UPI001443B445|nr:MULTISPECIES: Abi family protein [Acinetobacter]
MLKPYNKKPLSYAEQVHHLQSKGLSIHNVAWAEGILAKYGYYRLSAYWYPYRIRSGNNVLDRFKPGTSFEKIVQLYEFDTELRLQIFGAIEIIETFLRTKLTYYLGHQYGAFGIYNAQNFYPKFNHRKFLETCNKEVGRSKDTFIQHFQQNYDGFPQIPIWMLTEVLSFGSLSFLYSGLINNKANNKEDKKAIAQHFSLHHEKLAEWLHILTYVRNICAHHGRLWNKELAIKSKADKDPNWQSPITPTNKRIFYVLLILKTLLRPTGFDSEWCYQLNKLLKPIVKDENWRVAMGFPGNWEEHPIWSL